MILCADDFGLNNEVSQGILNLIQLKKINSISCLTTTDCWKQRAGDLKPFLKNNIEAGLHLTLTYPPPIGLPACSLNSLIKKSYLRQLDKKKIICEIRAQIKMFKKHIGSLPSYVDGHEFCHHFPIIREALLDIAEEFQFKENNIYVRVFCPGRLSFLKNSLFYISNHLASLPSIKLRKLLKTQGISFNSCLLGFHPYCLEPKEYFDWYLRTKPSNKDIFFCHPGLASKDKSDSLRGYRPQIYNFLMSSHYDNMLKRYNIKIDTPGSI